MRLGRHIIKVMSLSALLLATLAPAAYAADDDDQEEEDSENDQQADEDVPSATVKKSSDSKAQAAQGEKLRVASSTHVRRFHEVLDEILAEFGYDVKMGQIKGLANLSIRKVRVSDAIPRTYEDYVETLLVERIRENSQVRLISCVPCNTRTSSVVDGKLMVTSPATNIAKLESAATQLGIENFMDAVLVYHTTHMVLAVSVFNAQSKELVWARTYNSETVRSRYQKLAVDYSQIAKSRVSEEYTPEYRFLFGMGGATLPNVGGTKDDKSMINIQIRGTEKFDNRRTEFGMLLSVLKTTNSILNDYPTEEPVVGEETTTETETAVNKTPAPKAFQQAFALYGLYGHQFLGPIESYNEVRHGLHAGVGALLATGYLAPTLRVGWDVFMGRRFATSLAANYVAASTILIGGKSVKTKGGAGADLILSLNY